MHINKLILNITLVLRRWKGNVVVMSNEWTRKKEWWQYCTSVKLSLSMIVNVCKYFLSCTLLPPSLTHSPLSLIECKYCLKGEGLLQGGKDGVHFVSQLIANAWLNVHSQKSHLERGNQIGSMHAMPVSDAHTSLYSSSMTIHLTINASISSTPSLTSVSQGVGRMWMAFGSTCTLHASVQRQEVEGERMLAVIKNNMTFLDIKWMF